MSPCRNDLQCWRSAFYVYRNHFPRWQSASVQADVEFTRIGNAWLRIEKCFFTVASGSWTRRKRLARVKRRGRSRHKPVCTRCKGVRYERARGGCRRLSLRIEAQCSLIWIFSGKRIRRVNEALPRPNAEQVEGIGPEGPEVAVGVRYEHDAAVREAAHLKRGMGFEEATLLEAILALRPR